jgi:hypothetical protein
MRCGGVGFVGLLLGLVAACSGQPALQCSDWGDAVSGVCECTQGPNPLESDPNVVGVEQVSSCAATDFTGGRCCESGDWPEAGACQCYAFRCGQNATDRCQCTYDPFRELSGTSTSCEPPLGGSCCLYASGFCGCGPETESCIFSGDVAVSACTEEVVAAAACDKGQTPVASCSDIAPAAGGCGETVVEYQATMHPCDPSIPVISLSEAQVTCARADSQWPGCVELVAEYTACAKTQACPTILSGCYADFDAMKYCLTGEHVTSTACPYAGDGACDEPDLCPPGTDGDDCTGCEASSCSGCMIDCSSGECLQCCYACASGACEQTCSF